MYKLKHDILKHRLTHPTMVWCGNNLNRRVVFNAIDCKLNEKIIKI